MNLFNKIRSEKLIFIIFWFVTLDPLSIEVRVCVCVLGEGGAEGMKNRLIQ